MSDEQVDHGQAEVDVSKIDDVLAELDKIIEDAINEPNRIGYFAAMYRDVTANIRQAIIDDRFEDGPRMATFDHIFAGRFIDAYDTWRSGHKPTRSWQLALDATNESRLLILQHLLLGMNAHINLDLGITAAAVAREMAQRSGQRPADELTALKSDFDQINTILEGLTGHFESTVGELSPSIGLLERISRPLEITLVDEGIEIARDVAWILANDLVGDPPVDQAGVIAKRDHLTELAGKAIRRPGIVAELAIWAIKRREETDIPTVIRRLQSSL